MKKHNNTWDYKRVHESTWDDMGLHEITWDYMRLHEITWGIYSYKCEISDASPNTSSQDFRRPWVTNQGKVHNPVHWFLQTWRVQIIIRYAFYLVTLYYFALGINIGNGVKSCVIGSYKFHHYYFYAFNVSVCMCWSQANCMCLCEHVYRVHELSLQ